ncbi:MAG TPA: DoxX family protein [Alicycliphilus sp.]|nr:DoxX family protein [Alicycliphilus sp.]
MLNTLQNPLSLIGRLLLAWFFIPAGIAKIGGFAGTVGYASSMGMPLPQVAVAVGLLIEIFGGLALLLGWGARWAALVLAFFTLVTSIVFHAYWAVPAEQQRVTQLLFNKNIAVIGGLLVLAAFGAGAWSVDGKRAVK